MSALSRKKADLIAGRSLGLRNLATPKRLEATIELYLLAGFSANAACYWGFGPLHWSAWLGHAGADGGADPNLRMGAVNATPLGSALHGCFQSHPDYDQYLEVCRALLERGIHLGSHARPSCNTTSGV